MKKFASFILAACMMVSMSTIAFAETGAGLTVAPMSGSEIKAPGDTGTWTITDDVGNKIKLADFNSNFTIVKDIKPPIKSVEIVEKDGFAVMQVSLYPSNDNSTMSYNGKVTFKNKAGQGLEIPISGNAQNEVVTAQSNFKVSKGNGSKLYSFDGGSDYYIYFDGDAEVKLKGVETGTKSLAYNIDPVKTVVEKYSLSNSKKAAFINFTGEPTFSNPAEVRLFIPIETSSPVLYKLNGKDLEKIADVKVEKTNGEPILSFKTNSLSKTYVIAAGDIENTKTAAIENLLGVKPESITTTTESSTGTSSSEVSTQDVDDQSAQTGSKEVAMVIGLIVASLSLGVIVAYKKKK